MAVGAPLRGAELHKPKDRRAEGAEASRVARSARAGMALFVSRVRAVL